MLEKRYGSLVVREPEQQVAAFIGTGVHSMFEECLRLHAACDQSYEVERSVFDKIEDRLISGRFDILYNGKHLYDIKTCKTWKLIYDPFMKEWVEQQNIYAYMLRNRGVDVRSINIIAVYLDWLEGNVARMGEKYPKSRVEEYELPLWDMSKADEFIRSRINMMKDAEKIADNDLPLCTDEEMWVRNEEIVYAVVADPKAGRSLKNCSSLQEAYDFVHSSNSKKLCPGTSYIEIRKPSRKRCEHWCDGASWCNSYLAYRERQQNGNVDEKIYL
jgi:hypothetical protein